MNATKEKIAIIKLSAFGDMLLAFGLIQAIAKHHKTADLVLFTTKPFRELAEKSGLFKTIEVIERPSLFNVSAWKKIITTFRSHDFSRIYDLQNNDRTALLFHLLKAPAFIGKPYCEWVGTVRGCSHYTPDTRKDPVHAYARGTALLEKGGIENVKLPDLSWMRSDSVFNEVTKPYVLLIPGAAPTRPLKKWPAENYAALAGYFETVGMKAVIIGGPAEKEIGDAIKDQTPSAINLVGRTSFYDIAELARGCAMCIGNDTGPTHLASLCGANCVVLFSNDSDPVKSAPLGPSVKILHQPVLADLSIESVIEHLPL